MSGTGSAFLIDQLFPTCTIHLVSGPSGIGKTTYLLQLLNEWASGTEILGHASCPTPCVYISCARSWDETLAIAQRLDLQHPPHMSALYREKFPTDDYSPEMVLKVARERHRDVGLIVLDGIGVLCRGRLAEYSVVADFMGRFRDLCRREAITIIGVGPHSKSESEAPPRSRFLGSVAWGEYASTMLVIEAEGDNDRLVRFLPVNAAPEKHVYSLDRFGRFVLAVDDSPTLTALYAKLMSLPPATEFKTEEAIEWGRACGASDATVERWLRAAAKDSRIEKVRRGIYRVPFVS